MLTSTRSIVAAACLSVAVALPALAQQDVPTGRISQDPEPRPRLDQPQQRPEARQSPEQALEQIREREAREPEGARQIQIPERAAYGLGELPPELMSQAFQKLTQDPDQATLNVMQAANVLEIQSNLYPQSPAAQQLSEAARNLRQTAKRIELRQIVTVDELRQPFAEAAAAGAAFYQQSAARGLEQRNAEQLGYSLKGAASYLTAAHVFAGRQIEPQASLAAYNASVLSESIVAQSKLTTYELDGQARQAAARPDDRQQAAEAIPQSARQVIDDLEQAVQQASDAIRGGQNQPRGIREIERRLEQR